MLLFKGIAFVVIHGVVDKIEVDVDVAAVIVVVVVDVVDQVAVAGVVLAVVVSNEFSAKFWPSLIEFK